MNFPVVSCKQSGGWVWRGLALAALLNLRAATVCYGAGGTAAAWGDNNADQVSPIPPAAFSEVTAVAGGGSHSLALRSDGTVVAWGWDNDGQIDVPADLTNTVAIAASSLQSMALRADGTVVTWGEVATLPNGLTNITAIAAGGQHNLAVGADGVVLAWGDNSLGETNVPVGLSNVVAVAAGEYFSMALQSSGAVVVWGDNTYGQTNVPALGMNIVAIAAGGDHCLALGNDGTVTAWGRNDYGQATPPSGLSNVVAIAGGALHSLALRMDGTLAGWGNDDYGQCDVGASQTDYMGLGAGDYHSLTIRGDGAPFVLLQPASQTAPFGTTVAFQTLVVGTPPMTFQWQRNGRNISGATNISYVMANVQLNSGGSFTLIASNYLGTTTSKPALLTPVGVPPWILAGPFSVTNLCGLTTNLQVTATGVPPLSYQWLFQGLPVVGGTQADLTLPNLGLSQAGSYVVVITNVYGAVTSAAANVAVIVTPSITNQPQDAVTFCGADASFQVGAGGPTPLSYQWLHEGMPIAGATAMTLDLAGVTNQQAGAYSVAVACPCGSLTSLVANLTVLGIPLITNPPQDAVVYCGDSASFLVGATGPTPLTYQWFFGGTPMVNATNPTLPFAAVTNANAGHYTAVVTCPCGAITSGVADLIINPQPPLITSPLTATAVQGQPFSYTITALHNPFLYEATFLPPGLSLNPTNGLISGTNFENGAFYVQLVTLNVCSGASETLSLNVTSGAPVITSGAAASGTVGSAFKYTITATQSPMNYSGEGLPPGVIVNPATGVISGTPAYAGIFAATLYASNPWGTGSAPLQVSIATNQISGLSIVEIHTNYAKPYIVDVQFGLRDNDDPTNGNALVVDPSLLSVAAYENWVQVDPTETAVILQRVVPGLLTVEVNLVLDFSESVSSITLNGNSCGCGISDAAEAETSSAELFVTEQAPSTKIGVYEFHRKDLAPTKVVGLSNQTAAYNAIAGIWTNYVNFDTSTSRAWDALLAAIQTLGANNSSQMHAVVIVTDGNDNSSLATVQQIITAATNANVQVYCLGFGQNINSNDLQQIAQISGGLYYSGQTAADLAGEFAQVSKVFTGLYHLRWITPKQCGAPVFIPSFSVTYQGITAYAPTNPWWVSNFTYEVTNVDSTTTPPTTNVATNSGSTNVTNYIYFSPYYPCSNAGNVNIGVLDLQLNSAVPSGVSLYANYLPEYIRQFNLHYRLNWPGTVVPATNLNQLLAGWKAQPTDDGSNGTWLLLSSPDPYSASGVQINSLPWGSWGDLVDFNLRDLVPTNILPGNMAVFSFFVMDTNIYSNNIPGYFGQTMSNTVAGMITNVPVLPYGTPVPWLIANSFTDPTQWTNNETQDTDGDGMLNWQEYQANTNPNDRNSYLAVKSVTRSPYDGRWQVMFDSALYRTYQVQASTDMANWRIVQDAIPGTGTNITVSDTTFVPSIQTYYRILVY